MVKQPIKPLTTQKRPLNYTPNTLREYPTPLKSRQEINRENYQKAKEQRKEKRRERYQQQKLQAELTIKQTQSKYYGAEAIKFLMSLKEYTELNQTKQKLWLDFIWTFKTLNRKGFSDIIQVMKVRETAENLITDYWTTAKSEKEQKGTQWNTLTEEEQQRLIRHWSYEKARMENNYLDEEEKLASQSQAYLKEIELAKFHEERGKIKCKCYQCKEQMKVQGEIKAKIRKEMDDYDRQSGVGEKEQCPECGKWVKELDEENGICKRCMSEYE